MDPAHDYIQKARAAKMGDEDIIFELTKQGWSIPQVHKLIYGSEQTMSQMFTSQYSPPNQPTVISPGTPAQVLATQLPIPQDQLQDTEQPLPAEAQPAQMPLPQDQPQAQQPQSQLVSYVEPQVDMNNAMQRSKKQTKAKKFLKFALIALLFVFVGTAVGIGISYLYFQSQVTKYSSVLETGTIGRTSLDPSVPDEIVEINNEEGVTQPATTEKTVDPVTGKIATTGSIKTNSVNTKSKTVASTQAEQTSCKTNKSIPGGVCDAIRSLEKDASTSNTYLSEIDLSEIPGGVTIKTIDEKSWQAASGGGTIDAVADTILGPTNIRATFQQKSGNWKVVGIQIL